MKKITQCRVCKNPELISYLYLGEVPPANKLTGLQNSYPIELLFCQKCHLSQLSVVVDPKELYSDYPYRSSVSRTFQEHCYELGKKLGAMPSCDYPLVVDIASNDGCLMQQFERAGFKRFLGIEPSFELSQECVKKGFPCANVFWSEENARFFKGKGSQGASFITAQNVLAHVDDLHDFIRGVNWFLEDDGVFVAEFPYMLDLMDGMQIDTVYHEHLSYFLLSPLIRAFRENGMDIFHVERIPIHGGSLRIYASKDGRKVSEAVSDLLALELDLDLYSISTYHDFAVDVFNMGEKLRYQLEDLSEHSKIMGYGASAKGISLINYFKVGEYIHSIVDDTPAKHGKSTPGSHIPIVDFSRFEKEKPDYILLLAWNFSSELREKTKHLNCEYITPIPELRIG